MDALKASIFAACIIGIISCMADIAMPGGRLKNQVKVITAIILILAVFLPFIDGNLDLKLDSMESLTESDRYEDMTEEFQDMYLGMTSDKMGESIKELIRQGGIEIEKVVIVSDYGEYNSLEAQKVIITANELSDSDKEKIKQIISENLAEVEIEFSEEQDDNEY